MTRFFAFLVFIGILAIVGWRYAPENIRSEVAELIGVAQKQGEKEVKKFIEDTVLPKDPRERRRILTEELQKNIEEIKRRQGLETSPTTSEDTARSKVTLEELVIASEEALKELGAANIDESFGAKVTDKILDTIFPEQSPKATCECGEK